MARDVRPVQWSSFKRSLLWEFQQVKDLAVSLPQLGWLLWLRFDLWPRNFRMPRAWPKIIKEACCFVSDYLIYCLTCAWDASAYSFALSQETLLAHTLLLLTKLGGLSIAKASQMLHLTWHLLLAISPNLWFLQCAVLSPHPRPGSDSFLHQYECCLCSRGELLILFLCSALRSSWVDLVLLSFMASSIHCLFIQLQHNYIHIYSLF